MLGLDHLNLGDPCAYTYGILYDLCCSRKEEKEMKALFIAYNQSYNEEIVISWHSSDSADIPNGKILKAREVSTARPDLGVMHGRR